MQGGINKNIMVAYFSRKGQNYVNGKIVNLSIGNTEVVAKMIQKIIGSGIFHIDSVKHYPIDYTETTEVAKAEMNADAMPELTSRIENMDTFNVIFLGYPIWWGTFPAPVRTFLSEYDFSGKTIVPFCTHEGSGLGHSEQDIKKLCPKATFLNGIAIHGADAGSANTKISEWLKKINITK
ncbi:MAG: flavodoxin [Syntrophobacteraceae bacterium]